MVSFPFSFSFLLGGKGGAKGREGREGGNEGRLDEGNRGGGKEKDVDVAVHISYPTPILREPMSSSMKYTWK